MATWSSFEKDKLITEGWRKFLQEEEQIVFGINSDKKINPESLLSFLEKNQSAIGLSNAQIEELVALMLARTKEDDVVLEAIGGPQRDARTFSSDTTTKLNALIKKFNLESENERKLIKVLKRWAKLNTVSFEQGAPATPVVPEYEPDEDDEAPISSAEPEPVADEEEASTDEVEPDSSTAPEGEPAEKTPAETAVDLLNKVDNIPINPSTGRPTEEVSLDLFNSFVKDFKSFIQTNKASERKLEEISRIQLAKKFGLNSGKKIDRFFNNNTKYSAIRTRLTFMSKDAVNLFLRAFEQVAKSLPAEPEAPTPDTSAEPEPEVSSPEPEARQEPTPEATPESEPVPAKEEEPKEKTEEPNFTRRIAFKIKNYYNRLEIGEKLTNKFNIWKKQIEILDGVQSIEKFEFDKAGGKSGESVESFDNDKKDGLYLITLTNGEQFGLPKHTNDVSTLGFGFEWDGQIGNQDSLNKVTKLAKIKDGKIIKKGEITWGERGLRFSESILEESLMLRWKTIAGIK